RAARVPSRLARRRRAPASGRTGNAAHWLRRGADCWRVCFRRSELVLSVGPGSRPTAGGYACGRETARFDALAALNLHSEPINRLCPGLFFGWLGPTLFR